MSIDLTRLAQRIPPRHPPTDVLEDGDSESASSPTANNHETLVILPRCSRRRSDGPADDRTEIDARCRLSNRRLESLASLLENGIPELLRESFLRTYEENDFGSLRASRGESDGCDTGGAIVDAENRVRVRLDSADARDREMDVLSREPADGLGRMERQSDRATGEELSKGETGRRSRRRFSRSGIRDVGGERAGTRHGLGGGIGSRGRCVGMRRAMERG